jgi:hypothetical protein
VYVKEGLSYGDASTAASADTKTITTNTDHQALASPTVNWNNVSSLIPVTDDQGNISGYRYVMTEAHRLKWLGKDTNIEKVLGAMYESIPSKTTALVNNSEVVKELINEYETLYQKNPKGFITVTKDHPHYGEIYRLIPKEMKAELDDYFGKGRIVVRESMMDIIFGYRKYSLFTNGDTSWVASILRTLIVDLLRISKHKYYRYGRKSEQAIQELMGEIKKVIVLKTHVLGFNILSNLIVSFMHGMPLNYIVKKQAEASIAVEDYIYKQREVKKLEIQKQTIGISKTKSDNIDAKIAQYQKDMDKSPIKDLIDLGLLNSIVEDISTEDIDVGMRGEVINYVASKTKWVPQPVKTALDIVQISPKTGLYKLLEKTTRYSDFVARYAMYNWYLEKDGYAAITDPNTKAKVEEKALKIIIETFVNYDVPTSRELQYLNDIGLAMFTKYALRIQKSLFLLIQARPDSVIAKYALEHYMGNVVEPFDSLGLPWLNNPLDDFGVMAVPGAALACGVVAAIIPGL